MKFCGGCSEEKQDSEFGHRKYETGAIGLRAPCLECERAKARMYNRTAAAKIARARYKSSPRGRRVSAAYERSDAGKASQRRYRSSSRGRRARTKIDNTRRANKMDVEGVLLLEEWDTVLDMYTGHRGTMCAYCYEIIEKPTMDHIEPISRGGQHTAENIVPACKSCNSSKGAKPLLLWMHDKFAAADIGAANA